MSKRNAKGGNPLLAAYAAKLEARYNAQLSILLQMSEDACLVATQEVRGLGPDNAQRLRLVFRQTINEMSSLLADDEDPEAIYGRVKIDQRLEQIEGKDRARSWDDRMAWCLARSEVAK